MIIVRIGLSMAWQGDATSIGSTFQYNRPSNPLSAVSHIMRPRVVHINTTGDRSDATDSTGATKMDTFWQSGTVNIGV